MWADLLPRPRDQTMCVVKETLLYSTVWEDAGLCRRSKATQSWPCPCPCLKLFINFPLPSGYRPQSSESSPCLPQTLSHSTFPIALRFQPLRFQPRRLPFSSFRAPWALTTGLLHLLFSISDPVLLVLLLWILQVLAQVNEQNIECISFLHKNIIDHFYMIVID